MHSFHRSVFSYETNSFSKVVILDVRLIGEAIKNLSDVSSILDKFSYPRVCREFKRIKQGRGGIRVSEHPVFCGIGIKAYRKYGCTRQSRRGDRGERDESAGWRIARRGNERREEERLNGAHACQNERVARGLEKFMGFPLHGALISVAVSPVLPGR